MVVSLPCPQGGPSPMSLGSLMTLFFQTRGFSVLQYVKRPLVLMVICPPPQDLCCKVGHLVWGSFLWNPMLVDQTLFFFSRWIKHFVWLKQARNYSLILYLKVIVRQKFSGLYCKYHPDSFQNIICHSIPKLLRFKILFGSAPQDSK